jgi:hypothetical protein
MPVQLAVNMVPSALAETYNSDILLAAFAPEMGNNKPTKLTKRITSIVLVNFLISSTPHNLAAIIH